MKEEACIMRSGWNEHDEWFVRAFYYNPIARRVWYALLLMWDTFDLVVFVVPVFFRYLAALIFVLLRSLFTTQDLSIDIMISCVKSTWNVH